jgi:hypothetical protein
MNVSFHHCHENETPAILIFLERTFNLLAWRGTSLVAATGQSFPDRSFEADAQLSPWICWNTWHTRLLQEDNMYTHLSLSLTIWFGYVFHDLHNTTWVVHKSLKLKLFVQFYLEKRTNLVCEAMSPASSTCTIFVYYQSNIHQYPTNFVSIS